MLTRLGEFIASRGLVMLHRVQRWDRWGGWGGRDIDGTGYCCGISAAPLCCSVCVCGYTCVSVWIPNCFPLIAHLLCTFFLLMTDVRARRNSVCVDTVSCCQWKHLTLDSGACSVRVHENGESKGWREKKEKYRSDVAVSWRLGK